MVVISIKDGIDSSNSNSPPEGLDTVRVKIFEHTFFSFGLCSRMLP